MAHDTLAPWAELVPDAPSHMSAEDLLRAPDYKFGYELVEGRLVRMPPSAGGHGKASLKLGALLLAFVEAHELGHVLGAETGFIISRADEPDTLLAPDIAFVRADRAPAEDSAEWNTFWRVVPDLVVEVVSPSQYGPEMAEKARRWIGAGTRAVWIVWPERRQVDVYTAAAGPDGENPAVTRLTEGGMLDGGDVLPGFGVPVASIFSRKGI